MSEQEGGGRIGDEEGEIQRGGHGRRKHAIEENFSYVRVWREEVLKRREKM